MKPRAMKNGKTKKMMRGGAAEMPPEMMRGRAAGMPMSMKDGQSWREKNDAWWYGQEAHGHETRWRC